MEYSAHEILLSVLDYLRYTRIFKTDLAKVGTYSHHVMIADRAHKAYRYFFLYFLFLEI